MENFEDDDDTHYCNKCHTTINGLENYVRHRQSGCRTCTEEDKHESVYHSPVSTPNPSYPEILNADAFFSSLELQSSAKPAPRRATDLSDTRLRRSGRNEERRRKQMLKDKSPDEKEESKSNLMPVVTDLDDLGIPSLVGFPEIVSSSKPTSSSAATSKHAGTSGGAGSSNKVEKGATHQKHDWLEDTMLTDLAENKEDLHNLDRYAEYDYAQQDDESEDESLDVDMAEEESYSESDDPEHDQKYPPRSHTGGKWRPEGISSQEEAAQQHQQHQQQQVNEDEAEADEPTAHPPPSHTGGKWKPKYVQPKYEYENSKDTQQQPPPPGHTRGKWVPGARADIGTGYWCIPCGRKLASRLVYNRHLRSGLHARRSMREIDGVVQPRGVAPLLAHRKKQLSQRQKILATKKRESAQAASTAEKSEEKRKKKQPEEKGQKKQKRRREKEVLSCEVCRARVRRAQMGKHLLSHYHCRVAGAKPSDCTQVTRRFLLENMANIVRQCPFQCAPCRFYCNTGDTFLRHWRSDAHGDRVSQIAGSFVCALCDFCCDDNESVEAHIMKQGHQDVVSMINGSVPIVIRRQRVLACPTCCRRFRYNVQLRFHAKETGHEICDTASDEYQCRLTCSICGQILRSLLALQRHQLSCHKAVDEKSPTDDAEPTTPYFCSFCSVSFQTSQEAILHRRTSSHKEIVKSKKSGSEETEPSTRRSCPHCEANQKNLAEHKKHLLENHPELCYRCAKCGKQFALSQDVTKHTRENRCCSQDEAKSPLAKPSTTAEQWSCGVCPFASDSESEFLFHKILHDGPLKRAETTTTTTQPSYLCPICERIFRKCALRDHLRKHTGERPFPCGKCSATFARRSDRKLHQKNCQGIDGPVKRVKVRKYICGECDGAFYTKHILRQHMTRHLGKEYKCGLPGCPTILRTETELKHHRRLVHDSSTSYQREFQCDDCSYAAKTKVQLVRHRKRHEKLNEESSAQLLRCRYGSCSFTTKISSHMKRHVRLHTGKKPYKCRHCRYASNNLENLRKHVLSTNLHPGKMIYQCESCRGAYQTNFSKELRAHLLHSHPDEYPTPKDAFNYISTIFDGV